MENKTREAYRIVLNDILNKSPGMFVGNYNAKNGNDNFMHGIGTVMEYIAYSVDDRTGEDFSELFTKNLIKSIDKAKEK